jgi:hypothetical protein
MAKLPGRRARRLAAAAFGCALLAAVPAAAGSVDLLGTWHVLIHYTDDHSHDPSLMRWDDRLWEFEAAGSRLRWIEYPIVVFSDQAGRFESLGGTRAARVVHGWEPNESQRAQIDSGLEVNPRGSKTKTLRRDGDDWRSATRASPASASIVTYVETWSIEDAAGLPVFRREDTLGSGLTEGLDGVTEYRTTAVESGGDVLVGTFERDGSRHGTFRMTRSGDVEEVKGQAKSEGQRFSETYLGDEFRAALADPKGALAGALATHAAVPPAESAAARDAVRAAVQEALAARLVAAGLDPADYEREVGSLSRQIAAALLDDGVSVDEVLGRLAEGEINP